MFAIVNGRLMPSEQATLAITDPGVVHGAVVTDYCRTFRRRLFRHDDHLSRFLAHCEQCFIPLPFSFDQITAWAEELVNHCGLLLPPGCELALNTFATPGPTLILHAFALPYDRYRPFFADGVWLEPAGRHPVSDLAPPTIKHRSRLHWWRARHLVPAGALALLADDRGLTETAVGNLLLVRGGVVHRAPHGSVLDGVSQRHVADLCTRLNIPMQETPLSPDADEAMLCGSAFALAPVRRIGERQYPWPGPVYRRLIEAWGADVGVAIDRQFLSHGQG